MNIEKELKLALQRTEPEAGFSGRVLVRIRNARSSGDLEGPVHAGAWARIAATVLLVVSTGLFSSHYLMEIRRDAAGERAKQELILAMRIASEKTNLARYEVLGIGSSIIQEKGDRQ